MEGLYYTLTFGKTSGALLTWLRGLVGPEVSYAALLEEATGVPIGCEGLLLLPHFCGVATPTFRSDVRGGVVGLALVHKRAHFVRAVAEATCFLARDALTLARHAGQEPNELRMLGGATQSDYWMQMMADVVRLPLEIPACTEAALLGAAVFAGVTSGRFASVAEGAEAFYRPRKRFAPREREAKEYEGPYAAYREAMERLYPGALGGDTGAARGGATDDDGR